MNKTIYHFPTWLQESTEERIINAFINQAMLLNVIESCRNCPHLHKAIDELKERKAKNDNQMD